MTPKLAQLQVFIQANITMGKKIKTCQEWPKLVSGCFMRVVYKTTTCPRWSLLNGHKSGHLIPVLAVSKNQENQSFKLSLPDPVCHILTGIKNIFAKQ